MTRPAAGLAAHDSLGLLRRGFPGAGVTLNDSRARVRIVLTRPAIRPGNPPRPATGKGGPSLLTVPDPSYRWVSRRTGSGIVLTLHTASPQGVACGLYGLLQEKLGFGFIHPRQTIIPNHESWPLRPSFAWSAQPRFEKRGFHLHTLHPIELAEQLNNANHPRAFSDVKEYLDWLARNGQNVMQFQLLRGAVTDEWSAHAARIVRYAHERGILVGAAFSLSMIQQRSFRTINLLWPFTSFERRIDASLERIFKVRWDFATVDFTMGEHLPDLARLLPETREYLVRGITGRHRTPLFFPTHVIRRKGETMLPEPGTGILIHTVMNYAVTDPKAPVYGNENLSFMLDRAVNEQRRRETWFWPESSYWVAYDSPVPLLLLSYLDARWRDMNTMEQIGLHGHLTFSSGWEWGYWLVDWSVARWSWKSSDKGGGYQRGPLGPLADIFPDRLVMAGFNDALNLEIRYLKEKELIRYMSAATPFSELPQPLGKPFQPSPAFSLSRILHGAGSVRELREARLAAAGLSTYADRMDGVAQRLKRELGRRPDKRGNGAPELAAIGSELSRCIEISALRASHRALTIRAVLACGNKEGAGRDHGDCSAPLLAEARKIRMRGLDLVRAQERLYRYPVQSLARPRESMTAYGFGYLYPVGSLFFWEREEEQIRRRRFDPFFMNLWDFRRVLGLESLIF